MDSSLGVFFVGFTRCSLDFLIFPRVHKYEPELD